MEVLVGVIAGAALLALWLGATRRHLRRRAVSSAEWAGEGDRPELWTSSARCPACGVQGGVLVDEEDGLWFTCLSCRARHRRDTRA